MLVAKLSSMSRQVYSQLGPGFSESVYHNAMEVLLRKASYEYETERIVPIEFEGHTIGNLRADLIVNKSLIVELKAVKALTPGMQTQVKKYLQLLDLSQGLLVNFPQKEDSSDCEIVLVESSGISKEIV